ncbi:hypothetical protein ABZP36_013633 [Zizania latifolia]
MAASSSAHVLLPPAGVALLALLLVMASSPEAAQAAAAGLSVGFYGESCPQAEAIVRQTVSKAFKKEPGTPADLIRLFFHDCFVREDEVLPNVPHPDFNTQQLTQNFTSKGFTVEEMVTLSGAHSIGTSHCSSFTDRLYKYYGTYGTDPSIPATYAAYLKSKCPPETAAQQDPTMVQLDDVTPFRLDNQYYKNVLSGHVAFGSDVALLDTPETAALVRLYAKDPAVWPARFAAALVKVSKLYVLTGGEGEIRLNCSRVNS